MRLYKLEQQEFTKTVKLNVNVAAVSVLTLIMMQISIAKLIQNNCCLKSMKIRILAPRLVRKDIIKII